MVEIKYRENLEVSDIAGHTVAEARDLYKQSLDIAGKATAYLNGKKVSFNKELATLLNDDDRLVFRLSSSKSAYLVGALLLALAITGGIFVAG